MRFWYATTLATLLGASACRTTERAPESVPTAASDAAALKAECPPEEIVCSQEYEPTYCSAGSYDGRVLPDSLHVRAWGSNPCTARLAFAKAACASSFAPSLLGDSQCVPDASDGNCPAASVACGAEEEPTQCVATRYGDQSLNDAQKVTGWGGNPCLAQESLAAEACRRNLDPKALSGVTCGPDPQFGECPPIEKRCLDALVEATCSVTRMIEGRDLVPLEATGASACEANQRLQRLLCAKGLRPSDVEDVVCRIGK